MHGPIASRIEVHAEFFVEPFVEGTLGPHVEQAIRSLESGGFVVEVGPFSSSTTGELVELAKSVESMLVRAFDAGATAVQLRVTRPG